MKISSAALIFDTYSIASKFFLRDTSAGSRFNFVRWYEISENFESAARLHFLCVFISNLWSDVPFNAHTDLIKLKSQEN